MVEKIYKNLAKYYLFISQVGLYSKQGHAREAKALKRLIKKHKKSKGKKLLMVASGLGLHDKFLKKDFVISGIDKNEAMLNISRKTNPEIEYKKGDMRTFRINEKFDVVTCLDALAHLTSYENLKLALRNLSMHLKKGGLLIFSLDPVMESFKEASIEKYSRGDVEVTLIQLNHRRNRKDIKFDSCIVFAIKRKGREMEVYTDQSTMGLFEVAKVKKILPRLGFKFHVYENFSDKNYRKENPVFVCVKNR